MNNISQNKLIIIAVSAFVVLILLIGGIILYSSNNRNSNDNVAQENVPDFLPSNTCPDELISLGNGAGAKYQGKEYILTEENINWMGINCKEDEPKDLLLPIAANTCPDLLQFGEPSYAIINDVKYSFGEQEKIWIEANCPNVKKNISTAIPVDVDGVIWSYDMPDWISPNNAPLCVNPLEFLSPADISLANSILYPGQTRGTDYKTHGGLRFTNVPGNSVTVKMPDDAYLWRASKYIQDGEVQYLIEFMSKCGIVYKFDHLLTLSEKLSIISNLPAKSSTAEGVSYSKLTLLLNKGDVIATEVGLRSTRNVGFDFGVFDLRQKNKISQTDPTYISKHMDDAESAFNAICWLDYLQGNDKNVAKSLPVISVDATKESDYCD